MVSGPNVSAWVREGVFSQRVLPAAAGQRLAEAGTVINGSK